MPPFAFWDPQQFENAVRERGYADLVASGTGWQVSDFGLENFAAEGIVAFTARQASASAQPSKSAAAGALYYERVMVIREGQKLPACFYLDRMVDVINRGGGNLCMALHLCTPEDNPDETANVRVFMDGSEHKVMPGARLVLRPGESVTIVPRVFYRAWAERDDVIAAEIGVSGSAGSQAHFEPGIQYEPTIEDDEKIRRMLVSDYAAHFADLL